VKGGSKRISLLVRSLLSIESWLVDKSISSKLLISHILYIFSIAFFVFLVVSAIADHSGEGRCVLATTNFLKKIGDGIGNLLEHLILL
jgi:hypothetical protein